MARLTLQSVGHVYDDGTRALEGVDLELRRGEVVSIVGPSGCGKSTLLRVIAGLATPAEGHVSAADGRIGVVFQQPVLLPWRTVERNVSLPLELRGSSSPGAVDAALRDVGLVEARHKLPRQLSGGMQMRAAVARALVDEPDLLLLDEPFAAVDEMLREHLNDLFLDLRRSRRFSALFVTHSIAEAVYVSDRVGIMSARPGRFASVVDVPFGARRDADLRYRPEFGRVCGEVSARVRETAP